MYVHVVNNTIEAGSERELLPGSDRRLDTGQWVMGLPAATVADQQACGWFQVTLNPQPADTSTTRYTSYTVQLVGGFPTQVWTPVTKTAQEQTDEATTANRATVRADLVSKARAAITANNSFIANPTPSNNQVVAHVKTLSKECNGIIRLMGGVIKELIDLLDSDSDA